MLASSSDVLCLTACFSFLHFLISYFSLFYHHPEAKESDIVIFSVQDFKISRFQRFHKDFRDFTKISEISKISQISQSITGVEDWKFYRHSTLALVMHLGHRCTSTCTSTCTVQMQSRHRWACRPIFVGRPRPSSQSMTLRLQSLCLGAHAQARYIYGSVFVCLCVCLSVCVRV